MLLSYEVGVYINRREKNGMKPLKKKYNIAHIPTPIHRLERLSRSWGGDIWIKRDDQTGSGLSGNKIRKLEYLLTEADSQKADTIITCGGIQSNHCRATAIAAAQLGFKCILVLRGQPSGAPDGNLFLDKLAGAKVIFLSDDEYHGDLSGQLNRVAAQVTTSGNKPYIIPEGGSDPVGAWGYVEALGELIQQCQHEGIKPDRVVCATGSGGTHAGLWIGTQIHGWDVEIVSVTVCYSAKEIRKRIGDIINGMIDRYSLPCRFSLSDISVWDGYIGPGYARAGREDLTVITEVARSEGIILDPVYTGKAARALKEELRADRAPGISLLLHTGGIFGLFPFRDGFDALFNETDTC